MIYRIIRRQQNANFKICGNGHFGEVRPLCWCCLRIHTFKLNQIVFFQTQPRVPDMLGLAVNRQPGYHRRRLVKLETIPNASNMIDLRLMSNSIKVQKLFELTQAVSEQGPATCLIDVSYLRVVFYKLRTLQ